MRIECVTIDATDPHGIARFWAQALNGTVRADDDGDIAVVTDDGRELLFEPVSEPKPAAKNRLHLDLRPDDQDAEVQRLIGLGARRVDIGQGEQTWVVLADPDGNEFCVLRARR